MKLILSLLFAFLSFTAAWGPNPAGATGTAHDFGTGQASCAVCHLVIPISDSGLKAVWNRATSVDTSRFNSSRQTSSGTPLPSNIGPPENPSKICLGCHDGAAAKGVGIGGLNTNSIGKNGNISMNHPIGIPYPDIRGATYNSITSSANPIGYISNPEYVKLYGSRTGQKGIECTSCHDIHQGSNNKSLLRDSVKTLCMRCHIK